MRKIAFIFVVIITTNFAYGENIVQSVPNACDSVKPITLFAVFAPNQYECGSGYYLPANHDGCEACPQNYTCIGGTYSFNENISQGIEYAGTPIQSNIENICAVNFPVSISAVFTPNSHDCSVGYYLPANIDVCTECPSGSACGGGTFTFNETTDQGIQSCVNGFSPSGSAVCYPHIMHVGNDILYMRSTKLTTPSLNIDMDQDGIADFFINMTTIRTRMNKDSTHYLHADWGGNHYYICDDTTCSGQ